MGEEEIIENLNRRGLFKIKKIDSDEVEITTQDRVFILKYQTDTYLKLIDKLIDKQIFLPFSKIKKIPPYAQVLCNLKFDFIYVGGKGDWLNMSNISDRYVKDYQALIRLDSIGNNKFSITNIDRNRKLWN